MDTQLILILGGSGAVLLLLIGLVISVREDNSLVDKRLGYLDEEERAARSSGKKSGPLTEWLNNRAEGSSWGDGIAKELARADLKFRVGEYIAVIVISSTATAVIAWFLAGNNPIFVPIGAVVGFFLPKVYIRMQQGKRLLRFNEQLSDMLNLMVNGLRAGYSTMQAMEAVSKEMPPPISDEFRRVVQEMQLGVAMERSLDNLLRRIPSPDLDLIITAINVQREVGGNLAEILDTISHTIRERVRIKGEIRVLTSQQVYSGRLLAILPVLLLLAMYGMNRSYVSRFFEEPKIIGIAALILAGVLIVSGYFVMNKISNIEV